MADTSDAMFYLAIGDLHDIISFVTEPTPDMRRFVSRPPALDLAKFTVSLAWHGRQQDTPRHIWLRRAIVAAAADMSSTAEPDR